MGTTTPAALDDAGRSSIKYKASTAGTFDLMFIVAPTTA